MSSKKKKKQRRRARMCNPPSCERITLQVRCERCSVGEMLLRAAAAAQAQR